MTPEWPLRLELLEAILIGHSWPGKLAFFAGLKQTLLHLQDDLEGTQLDLEAVRQETESQMAEMASQSANSNFAQDLENASAIMRALESEAKEKQDAANEAAEALETALQKQEEVKYITFHPPADVTIFKLHRAAPRK